MLGSWIGGAGIVGAASRATTRLSPGGYHGIEEGGRRRDFVGLAGPWQMDAVSFRPAKAKPACMGGRASGHDGRIALRGRKLPAWPSRSPRALSGKTYSRLSRSPTV